MPVILPMIMKMLGSTLLSMGMALITKNFTRRLIIAALEKLVKATKDEWDDKLLAEAKKCWEEEDEEAK